jgi:hypothetical protein
VEEAIKLARMLVEKIAEHRNLHMRLTVYNALVDPVAKIWSPFEVDPQRPL